MGTAIVTGRPQVVWSAPAGGGQVTLVNLDVAQTIFLDYEYNVTAGSLQLGPLNSLSFDGGRPIYAACFSGQADLLVMPGATNWSPSPAQISAQLAALGLATAANQLGQNTAIPNGIAATGTPLLHGLANRLNDTSGGSGTLSVPASSTIFPFVGGITKPGYLISISSAINVAATVPFLGIQMIWKDTVTGLGTAEEDWYIPATNSGLITIYGKGPVKGSQLSIGLQNLDPAQAQTVSVAFWETTHHIARDDWRSLGSGAVPGFSPAGGGFPAANALCNFAFSTSSNVSRLLPLYAGQAFITSVISGGTSPAIQITPIDPSLFGNGAIYGSSSMSVTAAPIALPRIPCLLTLVPGGSLASFAVALTIMEFAS